MPKKLPVKKFLPFVLSVICTTLIQAQTMRRPVAADFILTSAGNSLHADVFSAIANQASLAQLKKFNAGIYTERRFMLAELSFYNLVIALPAKWGNFGCNMRYYGFGSYNETEAGLLYGKSLGDKVDIGVQVNYYNISAAGYGHDATVSAEAGLILHLTSRLNAGVHVNNPAGGRFLKTKGEKLPFIYTMALSYDASDKFFIGTAIEKEEDSPMSLHAGFQYYPVPQLPVKAGFSTATGAIWFSIGLTVNSMTIGLVANFHQQLGFTPGLMIMFNTDAAGKKVENKL